MADSSSPIAHKAKVGAAALGVIALAFLGGFLLKRSLAGAQLERAEADWQKEMSAQKTQFEKAQAQLMQQSQALAAARFRAQVLASYREVLRAVLALEERNFGIAKKHAQAASKVLTELSSNEDVDQEQRDRAVEVGKTLAKWEPDVTEDVGALRKHLLALAEKLGRASEPQ